MATLASELRRPPARSASLHERGTGGRTGVGAAFWWLLAASLLVRLPGLLRPLLGHFSSKSILYAMIARNWARDDAAWWLPRVDCLYAGERGIHLVDYPVMAQVAAIGWRLMGGSLEVWGRATAIAFSVASVALVYHLARRWHGPTAALAAGWLLAWAPVSVTYGQSFMLESSLVFFTLAMLWSFDRWLCDDPARWLLVAAVCFGLLVLTKIFLLVWLIPLAALGRQRRAQFAARREHAFDGRAASDVWKWVGAILAFGLAALPAVAWYGYGWWISRADSPQAPHVFFSLHDSTRVHTFPNTVLFSGDFYRKLFDDFSGPALTPLGLGLLLIGLCTSEARRYRAWLAATGLLIVLLPLKFYRLNYYDLLILPPLCLVAGLGWQQIQVALRPSRRAVAGLLAMGLLISMRFAFFPAFVTPDEDRAVLPAAAALQQFATPGDPIVAVHGSNFDLLYYCDRPGWAVPVDDPQFKTRLSEAARQGARWLVIANLASLDEQPHARECLAELPVVTQGDDFRVFRLAE